jgi:hypothetical protein
MNAAQFTKADGVMHHDARCLAERRNEIWIFALY